MNKTQESTITVTSVRRLCQCMEASYLHQPGQCDGSGDLECAVCGRQVCSECYVSYGKAKGQSYFQDDFDHRPICITCEDKERVA